MANQFTSAVGKLGGAIGKGLLAGVVGTIAITVSQTIAMKITGGEPSDTPAEAAGKVLGVEPRSEEGKEKFNQEVHWAYGTGWGVTRGILGLAGLKGIKGSALHFVAITATAMLLPASLKVAPPVKNWRPKDIVADIWHHIIYAVAAGWFYDAITKKVNRKAKPEERFL